jgi:catechol 2,3-dioxygenase-like lactoylglutathione lyase family enzyme
MDMRLELVILPVSDVDKSRDFYVQAGFNLDFDQTVSEEIRFVQLTPPGSACSIAFGKGLTTMEPGSIKGMQAVVDDAAAIREDLLGRGIGVSGVADLAWGSFVYFTDPDGNAWALQQLPAWSKGAGGTGERPEA